jgi:hypothetical protein
MLENMERLNSRELDGMFEPCLRIRYASSEHRFLRLNTGGRGNGQPIFPGVYLLKLQVTHCCPADVTLSWVLLSIQGKFQYRDVLAPQTLL